MFLLLRKQKFLFLKTELYFNFLPSWQKVASLKSKTDAAAIPAARKADLRARVSQLEVCVHFVKQLLLCIADPKDTFSFPPSFVKSLAILFFMK